MEVSIVMGASKIWSVYKGTSQSKMDDWGFPNFRKPHDFTNMGFIRLRHEIADFSWTSGLASSASFTSLAHVSPVEIWQWTIT